MTLRCVVGTEYIVAYSGIAEVYRGDRPVHWGPCWAINLHCFREIAMKISLGDDTVSVKPCMVHCFCLVLSET